MDKDLKYAYRAPVISSPWKAWVYFIIGVIPVICFRLVTIAQHYSNLWARIVWYTAVISSFIFFWYRFFISRRRCRTIMARNLINKLDDKVPLDEQDYKSLNYILSSLMISKERINYLLIFIASFISLAIAVYLDFFR
jgi:hypothetical protein